MIIKRRPLKYWTRVWQPWFAWYPVMTIAGDLVWFSWIYCRKELPSTDAGYEFSLTGKEVS